MKETLKAIFILTLFLSGIRPAASAQYKAASYSNGILPELTPPSPEASSLGKFGDWPVSMYTGVPNISIPIYTVSQGKFQLPVQLSYHAGGVKIEDVASWTGTGWTLNAGGAITRTIVGQPDEQDGVGLLYRNLRGASFKPSYDLDNRDDYLFISGAQRGSIDVEPDIFYYNFGNMSGRFYFDASGGFQCIPVNTLKLVHAGINNTLDGNHAGYWEIADEQGNLFYFGPYDGTGKGVEKTGILDATGTPGMRATAWYLTKVVLANSNGTIYLDYLDRTQTYYLPVSQSVRTTGSVPSVATTDGSSWEKVLGLNSLLTNGSATPGALSLYGASGNCMLQKIRWAGGELDFDASTPRQDVAGSNSSLLDDISLYTTAGGKAKLRGFSFRYSYTNQRYYLDQVTESAPDGTAKPPYSFSYLHPELLPAGNTTGSGNAAQSFAQDHWGYFNGATGNGGLVPPDVAMPAGIPVANREPSDTYMPYGTLDTIGYPTGGYTTFDYEANRYDASSNQGTAVPAPIVTYQLSCTNPSTAGTASIQAFSLPFPQSNLPLSIQFKNYNKNDEHAWDSYVRIDKLLANGSYQVMFTGDAASLFPDGNAPPPNQLGLFDFNYNTMVSLAAGDYRLVTGASCLGNCGAQTALVAAQMTYSGYQTGQAQSPLAGGLRVKQVTSYSAPGVFAGRKVYSYGPGRLLVYPKYVHQYAQEVSGLMQHGIGDPPCSPTYVVFREVTSSSQAVLGFTQGSPVGYPDVQEKEVAGDGTENGYTAYSYSFDPDVLNANNFSIPDWTMYGVFNPLYPADNHDYKRGNLLSKNTFRKNADGGYTKLHSLQNSYGYNDGNGPDRFNTLKGMAIRQMANWDGGGLGVCFDNDGIPTSLKSPQTGSLSRAWLFSYSFYNDITSWVQLASTTEIKYDQNGLNPVTSVTAFGYNNPAHLQVTSAVATNSKGETITSTMRYPHDFPTTAPYDEMINRNMVSPVIEQVQTNTTLGKEVLRIKNNYSYFNGTSQIRPSSIAESVAGNLPETITTFDSYDAIGNLQQATGRDGLLNTYLWGYNSQYPVAKVVGSGYAAVKGLVTQTALDDAIGGSDDAAVRSVLAPLGNIPDALATTFTYAPLIGITSQTNPAGRTTYYEYDAMNRLSVVRDQDNNILKRYCYSYAGQTGACPASPQLRIPTNNGGAAGSGECDSTCGATEGHKCIDGICEVGTKVYSSSVYYGPGDTVAVCYDHTGSQVGAYTDHGTVVYGTGFNVDGTGTQVEGMWTGNVWRNEGWQYENGPFNRTSVWACGGFHDPSSPNLSYNRYIDFPTAGTYYVGISADNSSGFSIDSVTIVNTALQGYQEFFRYWSIYPITVTRAGIHKLTITGTGGGSQNYVGCEVYNNTLGELVNATAAADLDILYSSGNENGGPPVAQHPGWKCTYHYHWSNGTNSQDYTEMKNSPCQ